MSGPLILNILEKDIQADLLELSIFAREAVSAMKVAHRTYASVEPLKYDLKGLSFKRHKFELIAGTPSGRYIFRQLSSDQFPKGKLPNGYTGDVLIPVWVSNRDKLDPDYRAAKQRIVARRGELGLTEAQARPIRTGE